MRAQENRHARSAQLANNFEKSFLVHGIKPGERLVQNRKLGAMQNRSDELHFLLVAFGELIEIFFSALMQSEALQPLVCGARGLRAFHAAQHAHIGQRFLNRNFAIESALLRQIADLFDGCLFVRCAVEAIANRAAVGSKNMQQHAHDRGFARAIRPEQRKDFSRLNFKRETVNSFDAFKFFFQGGGNE